jgi:hypothetical protein
MKKHHGLFIGFAILLLAAIFTFTGCPTDDGDGDEIELPAGVEVLFGVWEHEYENTSPISYTFSATSFKRNFGTADDPDADTGGHYTVTADAWKAVVNTDEATKEEYPAGYQLTGKVTAMGENNDRPEAPSIGAPFDKTWFLSADKTKLFDAATTPSEYSIYIKVGGE